MDIDCRLHWSGILSVKQCKSIELDTADSNNRAVKIPDYIHQLLRVMSQM